MRRQAAGSCVVFLLLFLLVGVPPSVMGGGPASAEGLTINEYMRCPEPPSDSVLTLESNGAAKITVMRGMDRRTARTLTNYKQLTSAEMGELATLLRSSEFDRIPEAPRDTTPWPSLSKHPCLITLEIHLDGKVAHLRYDTDPDTSSPTKVLAGKISEVLNRHEWKEAAPR
jgi:hypothetical protein